jgi:hypothetical protein
MSIDDEELGETIAQLIRDRDSAAAMLHVLEISVPRDEVRRDGWLRLHAEATEALRALGVPLK